MNNAHDFLINLWKDLNKQGRVIPFNPEWRNGTGYYNGAADIRTEHPVAFIDNEPNNRRGVILPIGNNCVVFFERFTPGNDVPDVVVSNGTVSITGAIKYQTITAIAALAGINPYTVGLE